MYYKEVKTSKKAQQQNTKGTIRDVLEDLNSPNTIAWLERLTGIDNLIPDPDFNGGGMHHIPPGGFLNIHADFNWHPRLKAVRKLNLLLYLNEDWKWNGELVLCDKDVKPVKKIYPLFNRCVIFKTTDTSYHGHPEPLKAPVPRKSLALYYYRKEKKPDWVHSTLYV